MPAPAARKRRIARDAALLFCLLAGLLALFLALAGTIAPIEAGVGVLAALAGLGAMRLAHDPRVARADRTGRPPIAAARLVAATLAATARDCVLVAQVRQKWGRFSGWRGIARSRIQWLKSHAMPVFAESV